MIEPLDVAWTVDTMTCSAAVRGANQTDLLVVAQSANRHASSLGDLADPHARNFVHDSERTTSRRVSIKRRSAQA